MSDWHEFFKGKKITVMGMGLQGGVGDIRFLAEAGAELIVTDLKSEEELTPSLEVLKAFPNIQYTLGQHETADFQGRDLVIKAPGTPIDSPYIAEARAHGTPVTMWAALLCRFAREIAVPIIGITGTRGKTTTTLLIAHILTHAGRTVIAGGNVQGTAILSRLPDLTKDTVLVLELDSWKLQGFGEEHISPNIAVFTTFYSDHMNYYKGDLEQYFLDKAQIFLYQHEGDVLIAGSQVAPLISGKFGSDLRGAFVQADERDVLSEWSVLMPGVHNRYNAGLAVAVARRLGVDDMLIKEAVESFPGVPGRLELVGEKNGVRFYNDTTATAPEGTIAALRALSNESNQSTKHIILIAGGADKGLDMQAFIHEAKVRTKKIVLLAGSGTEGIKDALLEAEIFDSLSEAFAAAVESADAGDCILLSPAFASFGMFKNEYDRGDQFTALVHALATNSPNI